VQITVTRLALTPVKATRLREVAEVELDARARGNRSFYVVDDRGRMISGKQLGELQAVVADHDPGGELTLTFPNGSQTTCDMPQP
jgi:uncharacterized protein YcbX